MTLREYTELLEYIDKISKSLKKEGYIEIISKYNSKNYNKICKIQITIHINDFKEKRIIFKREKCNIEYIKNWFDDFMMGEIKNYDK